MAKGFGATNALPEQAKKDLADALKKIMGEGTSVWFGTDGKMVVQMAAADWPAARKLLDDHLTLARNVGQVEHFGVVRKEMPAEATLLSLIDFVPYLAQVTAMVRPALGGFGVNIPEPKTDGKPSYLGVAVVLKSDRATFDLLLSTRALRAAYDAYTKGR
jgi:hypothetical protein